MGENRKLQANVTETELPNMTYKKERMTFFSSTGR